MRSIKAQSDAVLSWNLRLFCPKSKTIARNENCSRSHNFCPKSCGTIFDHAGGVCPQLASWGYPSPVCETWHILGLCHGHNHMKRGPQHIKHNQSIILGVYARYPPVKLPCSAYWWCYAASGAIFTASNGFAQRAKQPVVPTLRRLGSTRSVVPSPRSIIIKAWRLCPRFAYCFCLLCWFWGCAMGTTMRSIQRQNLPCFTYWGCMSPGSNLGAYLLVFYYAVHTVLVFYIHKRQ